MAVVPPVVLGVTMPVVPTVAGTGSELFQSKPKRVVTVPALSVLVRLTEFPRESMIVGVRVTVVPEETGIAVAGLAESAIVICLTGHVMKSTGVLWSLARLAPRHHEHGHADRHGRDSGVRLQSDCIPRAPVGLVGRAAGAVFHGRDGAAGADQPGALAGGASA